MPRLAVPCSDSGPTVLRNHGRTGYDWADGITELTELEDSVHMALWTPRPIFWRICMMLSIAVLVLFGSRNPWQKVKQQICPVTGSMRIEVTTLGYFKREERTVSALETWLKRREPGFEPKWQTMSVQDYYLVTRRCGVGHAEDEIYGLRLILDGIVEKLSEERISALVAVLRNSSRDESMRLKRQQMVESIAQEFFELEVSERRQKAAHEIGI